MPYFKLIVLAVTAVNCIAAQSIKNGELEISDLNSESRKRGTEFEIQNGININRNHFMQLKKYPDLIEQQQNLGATDILYNDRKNAASIPPPLLKLLYSHGTMKFPNKRTQQRSDVFPPQTRYPKPQQPSTLAGFVVAYSPKQTTWNPVPMPQEQISDEPLDPLAVEESQVFIEIAQPQSGYQPKSKQSQYTQPAGGLMQIDTESADVEEPVQISTSTNSAKIVSKMNRLNELANSQMQPAIGVQQQHAVSNTVVTHQQQPRAVSNRVGLLPQQQPAIQTIGRTATVAVPQHPPVVSGFPTFSISFDPLNFLLSLLNFLPIPKLNLDGRTFFGVELKKGFNFPPNAPGGSAIQIGQQQQQPYRRGAVIHIG